MALVVNGRKNVLDAEFMRVKHSLYSGETSTLTVSGVSATFACRSEDWLDADEEEYDPLLDRFVLSSVTVNGCEHLTNNNAGPGMEDCQDPKPTILYGPDVVNGYENGNLFLGVIINIHHKEGLIYTWFWNGRMIFNGPKCCLIKIKESGTFHCFIKFNDTELKSNTVHVSQETKRLVLAELYINNNNNNSNNNNYYYYYYYLLFCGSNLSQFHYNVAL